MCATPKPFPCCEGTFCSSIVVMLPVLMSWSCLWVEMNKVVSCEVTWGELLWHVTSCHFMRCDCLYCVMLRDAMRCRVMCTHVMSFRLVSCNGMECCALKMPLVVRSRYVNRSRSVTMWWSKVLVCTLLCTTLPIKYDSNTTLVKYYSVFLFLN